VHLLHYGHQKLTKTKFLPFDDYFYMLTWACGIGDIAVTVTYLKRAAQILLTATKIVLETHVLFLLFHHGVSPHTHILLYCDTNKYIN